MQFWKVRFVLAGCAVRRVRASLRNENHSVAASSELHQGFVNGGFPMVVRVCSGGANSPTSVYLDFTSSSPLFNLIFTLAQPAISNHGLETTVCTSLVAEFSGCYVSVPSCWPEFTEIGHRSLTASPWKICSAEQHADSVKRHLSVFLEFFVRFFIYFAGCACEKEIRFH